MRQPRGGFTGSNPIRSIPHEKPWNPLILRFFRVFERFLKVTKRAILCPKCHKNDFFVSRNANKMLTEFE